MPGVSIHAVDVSRGAVAAGMQVELYALTPTRRLIASGRLNAGGSLEDRALDGVFGRGQYEAIFRVAAWYRDQAVALPEVAFLEEVVYRFGIDDPAAHYHLPFKCTPWGFSCFRGGK